MFTITKEKKNIWSGRKEESRAELSVSKHAFVGQHMPGFTA